MHYNFKKIKHMIEEKTEEWRDIKGCENYQVSSLGRVKSLKHNVKSKNGSYRTVRERILKPGKNRKGYLRVCICEKGKKKNMTIHRLVCEAFLQNPLNLPQINHRNENKTDNRIENLEYCTAKYNSNFGTRTKRLSKSQSKSVKCLETGKIYTSLMEIGRKFGFSIGNICECCNGKRKSAYGFHWQYV